MKRVLVDSNNNVVYTGIDSKELLRVLNSDIYSVTEEDELKFGQNLYLKYEGELEYQVHFDLEFEGIDDWNRPVFKDQESVLRFGDTNKLWTYQEAKDDKVITYYEKHQDQLEYFGSSFNCEPQGGTPPFFKFNFI